MKKKLKNLYVINILVWLEKSKLYFSQPVWTQTRWERMVGVPDQTYIIECRDSPLASLICLNTIFSKNILIFDIYHFQEGRGGVRLLSQFLKVKMTLPVDKNTRYPLRKKVNKRNPT